MSQSPDSMQATVLEPATLVAFQEGAVVSRTLLKQKHGNLTAFAFGAGQGLSEHSAPFAATLVGLAGQAEVTIGGKLHQLGPGQVVIMPANVPHALKAISDFRMLLVMIRD
mgnify:CR=1 FL=1|jgi:quercetin dioxygenase-like cupin family protein